MALDILYDSLYSYTDNKYRERFYQYVNTLTPAPTHYFPPDEDTYIQLVYKPNH